MTGTICVYTSYSLSRSYLNHLVFNVGRSQWPSGLRRGSAAARLLGLQVIFPPRAWMFVCC
jgi:hypothetical protein